LPFTAARLARRDLQFDEFSGELGKPLVFSFSIAPFDEEILALDVAVFAKALP